MINKNEMTNLLIDRDWYFEISKDKSKFVTAVNPGDISKYISLDELNIFTRERLAEMFNDPSNFHAYYTPQQLAKINIEQMISENDISGSIYDSVDGRILELECDSDTYRLSVKWFINIDKSEGVVC